MFYKILILVFSFCKGPLHFFFFRNKSIGNQNFISTTSRGLKNLKLENNIKIPEFCQFNGSIKIGSFTTLGVHNYFHGDIEIGRYCQIGGYVAIHSTNHPLSYPTTYINHNLLGGMMQKLKTSKKVVIGNDVWIGHGVIILQGVYVGDGSILAAGSIITKDVEPYTIVGGNPAKLIRKRFSDNLISELTELKWWSWSTEFLEKNKSFFLTNLDSVTSIQGLIKF